MDIETAKLMTVPQLRQYMREKHMSPMGNKTTLLKRLREINGGPSEVTQSNSTTSGIDTPAYRLLKSEHAEREKLWRRRLHAVMHEMTGLRQQLVKLQAEKPFGVQNTAYHQQVPHYAQKLASTASDMSKQQEPPQWTQPRAVPQCKMSNVLQMPFVTRISDKQIPRWAEQHVSSGSTYKVPHEELAEAMGFGHHRTMDIQQADGNIPEFQHSSTAQMGMTAAKLLETFETSPIDVATGTDPPNESVRDSFAVKESELVISDME